jgi:hypothetical protein
MLPWLNRPLCRQRTNPRGRRIRSRRPPRAANSSATAIGSCIPRLSPPRIQDPGIRQPRRRPVPYAPDAQHRGGADRPHPGARDAPQRGFGRGHRAFPRSWPYPVRPCRAGCPERLHARAWRLRAQPAEPAHRRSAGGALRRLRRPQPDLRNARRHSQALRAEERRRNWESLAGASSRAPSLLSRRSCATWPTRSATTTMTSTMACDPG